MARDKGAGAGAPGGEGAGSALQPAGAGERVLAELADMGQGCTCRRSSDRSESHEETWTPVGSWDQLDMHSGKGLLARILSSWVTLTTEFPSPFASLPPSNKQTLMAFLP